MPNELAYFLRDCLFADFVSDFVAYFLRKNFSRIHLNQEQIDLREDNRYENRIIIRNSFSEFNTHFHFLKNNRLSLWQTYSKPTLSNP
jgi:hypothetical protein